MELIGQNLNSSKLCPRCPDNGRPEPNERHVSKSGRVWGYCKPCTYEYQKVRRDAMAAIVASKGNLTNEVEAALDVLAPKTRGRKHGDNTCPRCEVEQRQENAAYCAACAKAYRKDRNEERIAAYNEAKRLNEAAKLRKKQEADEAFEAAFGFKPKLPGDED